MLSPNQIRANARQFSLNWKGESRERAESQTFWNEFFAVFGVNRRQVGTFEATFKKLKGTQGFIDVYWPKKLVCEQKSRGQDLDKALTQALDYLQAIAKVAKDDLPRYVIVCDFEFLQLLDLETQQQQRIEVAKLADHIELFGFISGYDTEFKQQQEAANINAALRMGRLHDQLKDNGYDGHELRVMLIRLLFCLFAEDTGIFNANQFQNFLSQRTQQDGSDLAAWLSQLFDTLNREKRLKNLDEQLNAFAYINGELFKENIPPAAFDAKMRQELIEACNTDWRAISPEIFGSLFQSVMEKDERRGLGAHYTSEDNILKVINSLFLDELKAELASIKAIKQTKTRTAKLDVFHAKLAKLTFLDPACGCGNFLVVAYREVRLLELAVIEGLFKENQFLSIDTMVRCNVNQFFGIEIEEFPAQIARVAMWLVDHQMNLLVSERFGVHFARIPLKQSAAISHANALQTDWPVTDYILGNPPFVGSRLMNPSQKQDVKLAFNQLKNVGELDLVTAWYVRAARIANNGKTKVAFVSTNSIVQGLQVSILWSEMQRLEVEIFFAHRTFRWSNEAAKNAAVYCVIIGFAKKTCSVPKTIFDYQDVDGEYEVFPAKQINPYLLDANTIFIGKRQKALCPSPLMNFGNMPADGGHLLLSDEEYKILVAKNSELSVWIKPFVSAHEYLHNKKRWCFWLVDAKPNDIKKHVEIKERVKSVKAIRELSSRPHLANIPSLFAQITQPSGVSFVLIPRHSSENRQYIPLSFFSADYIAADSCLIVTNATLFHFGVMASLMHMAWVRTTCGRLESRYRYSKDIVYNNYPWPLNPTNKQKTAIEKAAQTVLDARAAYPNSSLADLYDPISMPPNLLKAHQQLDKAVDAAYGKTTFTNEAERVAFLFDLYQQYIAPIAAVEKQKLKKTKK